MSPDLSRRQLLAAAGLGTAATVLGGSAADAATRTPAQLSDIEHVVILMQENRSFDHYFGSMHGVRGFADPDILKQPTGMSVLYQPDPAAATHGSALPYVLPWHFDTRTTSCQAFGGLSHAWGSSTRAGTAGSWTASLRLTASPTTC